MAELEGLGPAQRELWDESRIMAQTMGLPIRSAYLFLGAQPRYYARMSPLPAWFWFWPRRRAEIVRLRQLLDQGCVARVTDHTPFVQIIEAQLARMEFAGKPLSVRTRTLIRRGAIARGVSQWRIRSAMLSMAVATTGRALVRRSQPKGIYWAFRIGHDLAMGSLLSIVFVVGQSLATAGCLTCGEVGLALLANILVVPSLLFYALGPEWAASDRLLSAVGFGTSVSQGS